MITRLKLGPQINVLRFDKKSFFTFFTTILGFTPYWDYKCYGNDYYNEKNINLSISNKIQLKCDCIDGSVLNSVRQPIIYSFVLDEAPGYKVFS